MSRYLNIFCCDSLLLLFTYIFKIRQFLQQHASDLKVFEGVPLFIGLGESHDDNKH